MKNNKNFTLKGGKTYSLPEQCAFLTLWTCSHTNALQSVFTTYSLWVRRQRFDAEKRWCTFTNVIVDLVSRGTGDQPLTGKTPRSVHAALAQLAGMGRGTLVYIWKFEKKNKRGLCQCEEKRMHNEKCTAEDSGWMGLEKAGGCVNKKKQKKKKPKHHQLWPVCDRQQLEAD